MKKVKRVVQRLWTRIRIARVRLFRWWHGYDKKYGWKWRVGSLATAALMLLTIVLPVAQVAFDRDRYRLDDTTLNMVGHTDPSLAKQLTYDVKAEQYVFNKDAIATGDAAGLPAKLQKATSGAADKSNAKTYSLEIPEDFSKGVTYHDTNSQLSFSLVPQFDALNAKTEQGHIVFPVHGGSQAVYTLKNNGLKEDIIVPEVRESTLTYTYQLKLPKTLEARALPDGSGAIGIYSANPALFGDISYGSDSDRARVEKAREANAKDTLVFGLPTPVTLNADGKEVGSTRFELRGDRLSVVAENLAGVKGPIAIDPSVTVTSSSDFQTNGNNEGMIDFGTSGQITRGGLTGGTLASWSAASSLSYTFEHARSVVYNGYIYLVGGLKRTPTMNYNTVSYAAINSDGTLGSWSATTSLPFVWNDGGLVAYNGYIYIVAGLTDAASPGTLANSAVTYYAPINANATVGSWSSTSSIPVALRSNTAAVYGGYLYALSGTTGSNDTNANANVYYAPINANGTVGTWNTTTSLTFARNHSEAVAYNGYMYILGGATTAPAYTNVVQYAKINSDGTLGSWNSTSNFTTARYGMFVGAYNGYMYLTGGTNGTGRTDTQYAQINANGSLGTWLSSPNSLSNAKIYPAGAIYNGYVYVGGGYDNSVNYSDFQYAAIDRAGKPVAFGTLTNNFSTANANICSVAYNGYLYSIGGSTTDNGNNNVTTVLYTALNSAGNNGSWTSTQPLPVARGSMACTVAQGSIFIIGGYTGTGTGTVSNSFLFNTPNSNGTLNAWGSATNLPTSLIKPGLISYANSGAGQGGLYALGGCTTNGVSGCSDVYYRPWGGSSWTAQTSMSQQWANRAYAIVGNRIYAYGGGTSAGVTSNVEYTTINSDGSLATWQSTTSLNTAIGYTNGTTINGCIYSVGGENASGTSLNNVQYACPNANGTISAWYNAPNLTVATTDLGVTSYNGYIYGVGGYTTGVQTTTQFAYVNNGGSGSNSAWSVGSNNLPISMLNNTATAYNGYLYSVGGNDGNNATLNSVRYSQIATNGDVGAFSTDSHTFTTSREGVGTVAYNGYLYVVGGAADLGAAYYGDVQYAPIGSNGALSGNFASTNSFVTSTGGDNGRRGVCTVAYNGYLYAIGGYDGNANHTDTRYAPINSNGTVGTWADSGNSFSGGRAYLGCFVANGYLYIVGGNGSSKFNDVQSAPINNNGTLGAWKYTSSFTGSRSNMVVGYSNGFAYITGGDTGSSGNYADTQYAPVYPNGTMGVWQQSTSSIGGACAGFRGTGVVYGGAIYRLGGYSPPTCGVMSETGYASLNSISRTARYSKLVDLGNPVSVSSITYNGTLPTSSSTPGVAPISFRSAGSDGVFGSATSSSAITAGATACLATSQNYKRYLLVTITLDGSSGQAILPDSAGTLSNVTDFTVNYITPHPAPNIRLRHGQTLQTGNLSPLDTCYP